MKDWLIRKPINPDNYEFIDLEAVSIVSRMRAAEFIILHNNQTTTISKKELPSEYAKIEAYIKALNPR